MEKSFVDGPYIYEEPNGLHEIRISGNEDGLHIQKKNLPKSAYQIYCTADNEARDQFHFNIMDEYLIPPCQYSAPSKLFIIADIEGNFNTLKSLLIGNSIIDKNYKWAFGEGHLVLLGDLVDRASNVLPVLWLIYKLEQEAKSHGGVVHLILGNHEDFFISANTKYVHPKYLFVAKSIFKIDDKASAYAHLISENLILRQWLLTKNTIEKIGNLLFVHGGISQQVLDLNLSILEVNKLVREGIQRLPTTSSKIPILNLLLRSYGPFWYRGFVSNYKDLYKKVSDSFINKVLDYYKVDHILIGHNMVTEISPDFNKKVIRLDVEQPTEVFSGMSQALMIESKTFYRVNDLGEKTEI